MPQTTNQSAKKKLTILAVIIATIIIGLVIWSQKGKQDQQEIVIGISPPIAKSLQVAVDDTKKEVIYIKLVEFSDWNTPNITLTHDDSEANHFQHLPFLDNAL